MVRFIGSIKDYEKYIGPRIRNIVNTFTKKERDSRKHICEFCGKSAELESAHKHGKERKQLIKEALKKYDNGTYIDVDVEKCEKEILELHNPINAVFHFLCHECHRKYDNNKSETSTEEQKSVKKQAKDEAFYKVEDIINIKGIDVPLYKNENEKTQDFIKKILHLFFKENLLPDIEIENMLNTDYCKNTFGISYSILQSDKTKLHDKTGRSRYWLTERFGKKKYYACSQ